MSASITSTSTATTAASSFGNSGAFLFRDPSEDAVYQRLRRHYSTSSSSSSSSSRGAASMTELQLWLNHATHVPALAEALRANRSVQEVVWLIHESFYGASRETAEEDEPHTHQQQSSQSQSLLDIVDLFQALGQLPQLRSLAINTYRFPFVATVPVLAVAKCCSFATNLVVLKLWKTQLQCCRYCQAGTTTTSTIKDSTTSAITTNDQTFQYLYPEIHALAIALQNLKQLREFRSVQCRITTSTVTTTATEEHHHEQETQLPEQHAAIEASSQQHERPAANLSQRLQQQQQYSANARRNTNTNENSKKQQSLGTPLDSILYTLAQLPQLQVVELSATELSVLGDLSPNALATLCGSSNSLREVRLKHFDLSEHAVISMAESLLPANRYNLRRTTAIKDSSDTTTRKQPPTGGYLEMEQPDPPLSGTGLHRLSLTGVGRLAHRFDRPIRQAWTEVLEWNYDLEELLLWDPHNLQAEIALYLKLNRFGRGKLLRSLDSKKQTSTCTSEEWRETLVQVQNDLDCLYYLIRRHPLLVENIDPTTMATLVKTEGELLKDDTPQAGRFQAAPATT